MGSSLHVITGCMYAGKSDELIRRASVEQPAWRWQFAAYPAIDARTTPGFITSRTGAKMAATPVEGSAQLLEETLGYVQRESAYPTVYIDEAQMFDDGLPKVIDQLLRRGTSVVVAGLDTDIFGQAFPTIATLMATADSLTRLSARCTECRATAIRTQLVAITDQRPLSVLTREAFVEGKAVYAARCRECFTPAKEK